MLRELATDCSFLVDYLNRDLALQILSGCRSMRAWPRMLVAAIDLDEYVKILESDKTMQEESHIFAAAAGNGAPSTVHGVRPQCNRQQKGNTNKGMQPKPNFRAGKYYACGQSRHLDIDSSCPLRTPKCKFCNKFGHWKEVCFTIEWSKQHLGMHAATKRQHRYQTHCSFFITVGQSAFSTNSSHTWHTGPITKPHGRHWRWQLLLHCAMLIRFSFRGVQLSHTHTWTNMCSEHLVTYPCTIAWGGVQKP